MDFSTSDRSRVFADNLALFVQHHLSRHGKIAVVARTLKVEPARLKRYASRRGSGRELRDIEFLFRLLEALGFDPVTVFSAAQRSSSLATLLALAEGSLEHRLSLEIQTLNVLRDPDHGRVRGRLELAPCGANDIDTDVA